MPRSARIDIPGILQHVIVRGIERCDIFRDNHDRESFLKRLSSLLKSTGTSCFAWALLSNHFHLLLMPTQAPLAELMRRLLTGHAVYFNRKYSRTGHLFQNRYKSIVCEEEPYLLELVRYIHLNPLRAGMVCDLEELDSYPWSGHAALMGHSPIENQEVEAILSRFGGSLSQARTKYREFIADGVPAGRRDDLVGGGRRRSRGEKSERDEDEAFDERILGGGSFVQSLRRQNVLPGKKKSISFQELLGKVCEALDLESDEVKRPNKAKSLAQARGVVCFLAVREFGLKGIEVGRHLNLGPTGVTLAARRGERMLNNNLTLKKQLLLQILDK